MTGTIPLSPALAEADPQSLNLLMSANPESPDFLDNLPKIVSALRAQAERFAVAEAAGTGARKAAKATKGETESAVDGEGLDF
jgi:hypothetical protein